MEQQIFLRQIIAFLREVRAHAVGMAPRADWHAARGRPGALRYLIPGLHLTHGSSALISG